MEPLKPEFSLLGSAGDWLNWAALDYAVELRL